MSDSTGMTVRRSYSIPWEEQRHLDALPTKFPKIKPRLNKSEIIRIGVKLFDELEAPEVNKILDEKIDRLKVGKPRKIEVPEEISNLDTELKINERQWKYISKLIPSPRVAPGKPKIDDRRVLMGILYIFRFDKQSRDVPKNYSSFSTCRRRLAEWRTEGIWGHICHALIKYASNAKEKNVLNEVLLRTWIIDIK
jgi:transposase